MFNELSISKVPSIPKVQEILSIFVKTYLKAKDSGLSELRLYENSIASLNNISLYDDYSVGKWLIDKAVDIDLREQFLLITTTTPLIKAHDLAEEAEYANSEFFASVNGNNYQVWGLGAAHVYGSISYSLQTESEWDSNMINISHNFIDENFNLNSCERSVRHFSSDNTLIFHAEWYKSYKEEVSKRSAELWSRREEFFANLFFLDTVEKQLKGQGNERTLNRIYSALEKLDKYINGWQDGVFSYDDANRSTGLNISPESDTTKSKFGAQRTFKIPQIGRQLFDLHIKLGTIRIHFFPIQNTKKVCIGYIGQHLRISSEN